MNKIFEHKSLKILKIEENQGMAVTLSLIHFVLSADCRHLQTEHVTLHKMCTVLPWGITNWVKDKGLEP